MAMYLYKLIGFILMPFIPFIIFRRLSDGKETKGRTNERYGKTQIKNTSNKLVWIHAASVGESLSIIPIVKEMIKDKYFDTILVTTGTTSSSKIIKQKLGNKVIHQFIPFDIVIYAKRFLNYWKPSLAIFVESEIWPNIIYERKKMNIPLIILNGRMTLKTFKRWTLLGSFSKKLFSNFDACCTQNSDSTIFYKKLGIINTEFTGNLKFAHHDIKIDEESYDYLKNSSRDRVIFLAASTHNGEENIIKNISLNISKVHKNLLTIIVPRHPQRKDILAGVKGNKIAVRSKKEKITKNTLFYIADTIGELSLFYKLANVIFVGGSMVNHGGQNPIEAAYYGKTILHGKNIQNFTDVYEILKLMKLTEQVENERQLELFVNRLIDNYKNTNSHQTKKTSTALKKEGNEAVNNSMNVINRVIGY